MDSVWRLSESQPVEITDVYGEGEGTLSMRVIFVGRSRVGDGFM